MISDFTENKIVSEDRFGLQIKTWQNEGFKIVFSNGCFDILHAGHVDYLEKARHFGDKLVIGLNSDASVKRIKGKGRPVVSENARAKVLAALQFVDLVTLFEEDTPLRLIEKILPDILVKGNDYRISEIIGAGTVEKNGGKVETIPLLEGFSTSDVINEIINKNK